MAANCLANSGSFFSSPAWKRTFSSKTTPPAGSASIVDLAASPTQSVAKATGLPSSLASGSTTGFSDISGTTLPLGRSKWASSATLAPLATSALIVGRATRKRVSSVIAPLSIGTLKSTRTRAVLPLRSFRSSRVLKVMAGVPCRSCSCFRSPRQPVQGFVLAAMQKNRKRQPLTDTSP